MIAYLVRVHCGGCRGDFVLSNKEGEQHFKTRDDAVQAGINSVCVQQMHWPWVVEEVRA